MGISELETGKLDHRPMFTAFEGSSLVWTDGTHEEVDTVVFATGYRPALDFLQPLGALTKGRPQHTRGISTSHPGLVFLGLEFQASYSSNTLRGVHRDAEYLTPVLAAQVNGAAALVRA